MAKKKQNQIKIRQSEGKSRRQPPLSSILLSIVVTIYVWLFAAGNVKPKEAFHVSVCILFIITQNHIKQRDNHDMNEMIFYNHARRCLAHKKAQQEALESWSGTLQS